MSEGSFHRSIEHVMPQIMAYFERTWRHFARSMNKLWQ